MGGVDLAGGWGVDSRGGYVLKILYVKPKESGPLGGVRRARPLDPPMLKNNKNMFIQTLTQFIRDEF